MNKRETKEEYKAGLDFKCKSIHTEPCADYKKVDDSTDTNAKLSAVDPRRIQLSCSCEAASQVLEFEEQSIREITALKNQIKLLNYINVDLQKQLILTRTSSLQDTSDFYEPCVSDQLKSKVAKDLKESYPEGRPQVKSKLYKNPYAVFSQGMIEKVRTDNKKLTLEQAQNTVNQIWGKTDKKARKPYIEMYNVENQRHKDEIKALEKYKATRTKASKVDDIAEIYPRPSGSAYHFFSQINLPKLMADKLLNFAEASKENGQIWKKMTDKEKEHYYSMNEEDKLRRVSQIKELKSKGYFTLPDGTTSQNQISSVKKQSKEDTTA